MGWVMDYEIDTAADYVTRPGAPDHSLDEVLSSVGGRVRHYRKLRALTLQQLAAMTGLSVSMLSTVERGRTGVSVASMHAIARALDVSITALFQASGPGDPVVRSDDQRRAVTSGGALRTLALADPDMRLELYVYEFPPGTASADVPSSHGGLEYGVSLTDGLVVEIDGEDFALAAGDAVQFSARSRHVMKNAGITSARAVWLNISRM